MDSRSRDRGSSSSSGDKYGLSVRSAVEGGGHKGYPRGEVTGR